jgi:hypothetical protein
MPARVKLVVVVLLALMPITAHAVSYTFEEIARYSDPDIAALGPRPPLQLEAPSAVMIDYDSPHVAWVAPASGDTIPGYIFADRTAVDSFDGAVFFNVVDCCEPGRPIGRSETLELPIVRYGQLQVGLAGDGLFPLLSPQGDALLNQLRPRGTALADFQGFTFGGTFIGPGDIGPHQINAAGQVAFAAVVDGVYAIVRADPVSTVPEPSTFVLITSGIGALGLRKVWAG